MNQTEQMSADKRIMNKIIITPVQKFIQIESSSGILLFGVTLIALFLANSPYGEQFRSLWEFKIGISTPGFELIKPLILWINDGLMTIFFFLIGLEMKRELLNGELNSLKRASLPIFAAVGGMIFPVMLYLTFNKNPETSHAWGIPMATDIAFTLAILTLLGKRVPLGLKVFLTAFAIVDDLGAVMIIALFYSGDIKWSLIAIAFGFMVIPAYLSYRNYYHKILWLGVGAVVWVLFLKAGIHPTISGVLMALTVPIRQKIDMRTYIGKLDDIVNEIRGTNKDTSPLLTKKQIDEIDNLEDWTDKVQSPLQHVEHKLQKWVAFLIMPVFALSNAGVNVVDGADLDPSLSALIVVSLVGGKLIGISLMSWIALKLKLAEIPTHVDFNQIVGAALLAGVGFTMSIFIANLSFPDSASLLDSAKIGILLGSIISGVSGFVLLRLVRSGKRQGAD